MTEISLADQISELAQKQREDNKHNFMAVHEFTSGNSAFNQFLATQFFNETLTELREKSSRTNLSDPSISGRFLKDLRGRVFQDLAFFKLTCQQPTNQVVLSPEYTLQIFRTLYPGVPRKRHPFGMDTLRSIPPHDAFIVKNMAGEHITTDACEITLDDDASTFWRKYSWYKKHKKRSPDLESAKCLFVVPKGNNSTPREKPTLQVKQMDFDYCQFDHLMGEVVHLGGDLRLERAHLVYTLKARGFKNRGINKKERRGIPIEDIDDFEII